jgi:ABC-type multidrug transport system permease subunit
MIFVATTHYIDGQSCCVFGVARLQLETVIGRIMLLPFLSMAAKLTPRGVEATMFACFMSIYNFSHQASAFWGNYVSAQSVTPPSI